MLKTVFDFFFAIVILLIFLPLIILAWIIASIDTNSFGIFVQNRIGQHGKTFKIFKIKTINDQTNKISAIGNFFRKSKLDELPQLINILKGDMSFVGPRPDIAGYYDLLVGDDRKILALKPGLTGPASIKYYNEELILSLQSNPKKYNDTVIFPDKVKINLKYMHEQSFFLDLKIIYRTIFYSL